MFLAPDNTAQIFESIEPVPNICTQEDMLSIQNYIFDKYFDKIVGEEALDLEHLLDALNKAAKKQFEFLESSKQKSIVLKKQAYQIHLYSQDAKYQDGQCHFEKVLNNVSSISLKKLRLCCNIYNITDLNNKIEIGEQGTSFIVTLPTGYYSIENILYCMTELFTKHSPNKLSYKASLNFVKHRIHISCINGNEPCQFTLKFIESGMGVPMKKLLGFNKSEYRSNNLYVSENMPIYNILNSLYMKLYVNNIEINKIMCSNTFTYFEEINIDLTDYFGKYYLHIPLDSEYYDFDSCLQIKSVSIAFYDQWFNPIELDFDCTMTIECN